MFTKRSKLNRAIVNNDADATRAVLGQYPELVQSRGARKSLSLALANASDEIILALSDAGFSLLAKHKYRNGLEDAAKHGRNAIIKRWCETYPDLWTDKQRDDLLEIAVREEQVDTLEFLLREGISDLSRCNVFNDPLHTARDMEYSEAVQLLTAWKKRHSPTVAAQPDQQNTQAVAAPAKPVGTGQWHVVDDTTIMRVRHQSDAGYRLTDIFNFAMGHCISLQCNLETDHETAVTSDLTAPACAVAAEQAYEQLVKRGGNPPPLAKPIVKKAIGE